MLKNRQKNEKPIQTQKSSTKLCERAVSLPMKVLTIQEKQLTNSVAPFLYPASVFKPVQFSKYNFFPLHSSLI